MRIVKFLISGGIGFTANIGLLLLCVEVFGLHYLAGSVLAFSGSLIVGFLLQKYWTFEERTGDQVQRQFIFYALLALFNLGINTGIVYLLVEVMQTYYLFAQAAGAATVAIVSFFTYREIIFKTPHIG